MIRPRTVAVNLRASPTFKAWLDAEKKRTNLTTRELLTQMFLAYVAAVPKAAALKTRRKPR